MPSTNDKWKHLTLDDREIIQTGLEQKLLLKEIAHHIGKDPTTVSKEIKNNRVMLKPRLQGAVCAHRSTCTVTRLCSSTCTNFCYKCFNKNCYKICPQYTPKRCTKTQRFPYVCNSCTSKATCTANRYQYRASVAHSNYLDTLKNSRQGVDLTKDDLEFMDSIITPLIKKGQSLGHIYANHKAKLNCCKRTLYNYIDKQLFTIRNIDLPRKVKFKKRKRNKVQTRKNQNYRKGRTYNDFIKYVDSNPNTHVVEMDTVYGKRDKGKVFLTFFFRNCSLLLAFILKECTQECVKNVLDKLERSLGTDLFNKTFPIILTDNGGEFKAAPEIEVNEDGVFRTKVFYCDPQASWQKARIEKVHGYIRYFFPKGKSFDWLGQEGTTLMINHINSTARDSLNGNTPYQLSSMLLEQRFLKSVGLIPIPADEVHLKVDLLKTK